MEPKYKADAAILDADFAIKVGRLERVKVIEEIIPRFIKVLYVHKHVYTNEILFPAVIKEQIDRLIATGRAVIVDREYIENNNPSKLIIYDETKVLLSENHEDTVEKHKNWGEIVSLSFAKAMGLTVMFSDEEELQSLVNEHLNVGDFESPSTYDIKVIRVKDFVGWFREDDGISRKTALLVWVVSGKDRGLFEEIWPK